MRQTPRARTMTFNAVNPQYNAFSGSFAGPTFGRGQFPQQDLAQINAVQDYPVRGGYQDQRRNEDRRQGRPERRGGATDVRRQSRRDSATDVRRSYADDERRSSASDERRSPSRDGRRDIRRDRRRDDRRGGRSDDRDRYRRDSRDRESPRSPRRESSNSSRSDARRRDESDRRKPQNRKEQYDSRPYDAGLMTGSRQGPREERPKPFRDGRSFSRKGCFNCGEDGHWAAECPRQPRRPPRSEKDAGRRQQSRSPSNSSRQTGNPSGR